MAGVDHGVGCSTGDLRHLQQLDAEVVRLEQQDAQRSHHFHTHVSRLEQELRELQQTCVQQTQQLVAALAAKGLSAAAQPTPSTTQPPPRPDQQHKDQQQAKTPPRHAARLPSSDSSPSAIPVPPPAASPATHTTIPATAHITTPSDTHTDIPTAASSAEVPAAQDQNQRWLLAMAMADFKLDPDQVVRHVGDLYSPDRGQQGQHQGLQSAAQQPGGPVAEGVEPPGEQPPGKQPGGRGAGLLQDTNSMLLGLDMKLALAAADNRLHGFNDPEQPSSAARPRQELPKQSSMHCLASGAYALTWSIIEPGGTFRVRWDLLVMVMLAYICIVSPYTICFGSKTNLTEPTEMISQIINLLFVFDIYLNFRTAIQVDERTVVRERKAVVKDYLCTWFVPDIISVLPYDKMLTNSSYGFMRLMKATRVIKLAKVLRLLKVVKVMRVVRNSALIKQIQRMAGHHVFSIMYFIVAAVFLLHWIACLFYYAASMQDLSKNTWVAIMGLAQRPRIESYITALYFSMSTLTTVGYGDIIPGNSSEKIVAMIGMTIGVTIFGYFMGAMSSMLSQMNSLDDRVPMKLGKVEDFIRNRKIPDGLAERIRSFFAYILTRQLQGDEEGMLSELSVPLRAEMVLFLYREALQKVPFFRDKDTQFIVAIVTCLRMEYFSPGDIVVRQGDPGNVMYFIGEGSLEVRLYFSDASTDDVEGNPVLMNEIFCRPRFKASETPVSAKVHTMLQLNAPPLRTHHASMKRKGNNYISIGRLEAGEYFGEYSCLLGECRSASVVAEDYCELYSLSRQDLDKVFEIWPEMAEEFQTLVAGYVPMETSPQVPTDNSATTIKTNPLWTRWLTKTRLEDMDADEQQPGFPSATNDNPEVREELSAEQQFAALASRAPKIAQGSFTTEVTHLLRRITADSIPQVARPPPATDTQPAFFRSMSLSVHNTAGSRSMRQGRGITAIDADVLSNMVKRVTSSKIISGASLSLNSSPEEPGNATE